MEHPSTNGFSNGIAMNGHGPVTREDILELRRQRDLVDQQIQALGDILKANHIGMTEPLVDAEQFPRNDIDVYQVRHARVGIIRLQNDYKRITKDIEEKLEAFYETVGENGASGNGDLRMEIDEAPQAEAELAPIAKINLVSKGSPAHQAGLKVDDLVLSFGSIDADNFRSIQDIGNLVQSSQGIVVTVKVKRGNEMVRVALIPGPWSGRGLLGCNITPIDS